MKTMFIYSEPRPVTFGELCEALADGAMPHTQEDNFYNVRKLDVSRLAEAITAKEMRRAQVETPRAAVQ